MTDDDQQEPERIDAIADAQEGVRPPSRNRPLLVGGFALVLALLVGAVVGYDAW